MQHRQCSVREQKSCENSLQRSTNCIFSFCFCFIISFFLSFFLFCLSFFLTCFLCFFSFLLSFFLSHPPRSHNKWSASSCDMAQPNRRQEPKNSLAPNQQLPHFHFGRGIMMIIGSRSDCVQIQLRKLTCNDTSCWH